MDVSDAANAFTACFTGLVAMVTLNNQCKKKVHCIFERTASYDKDVERNLIDHNYTVTILNKSEYPVKISQMVVCGYPSANVRFEAMELSKGESKSCSTTFYTKNIPPIVFEVALVRVNKETLKVYKIEVRERTSLLQKVCMRMRELL